MVTNDWLRVISQSKFEKSKKIGGQTSFHSNGDNSGSESIRTLIDWPSLRGLHQGQGMTFFPGEIQGGGFGPRAQGGIRGVDFWTEKLTNFDQNSNFSLF